MYGRSGHVQLISCCGQLAHRGTDVGAWVLMKSRIDALFPNVYEVMRATSNSPEYSKRSGNIPPRLVSATNKPRADRVRGGSAAFGAIPTGLGLGSPPSNRSYTHRKPGRSTC